MEWITWIVETLAEMELHLFQSMKKNLKRHQSEEEMRGYRWTQWQALQLQSINQAKNRYRSQINETFERLNPVAEQMITESFHEGAEKFDEQYAEFKKYQSTGVKWEDLPVPEPPKQPIREVTETFTRPQAITRGTDLFKRPEPLPDLRYAPRLRPKPNEIKVSVGATLKPAGDDTFFKVNMSKLDAVLLDVKRDMNVARYAAAKRMGVLHEDIVRKADIYMQTGTMTLAQAIDMASKEAAKAGLNCIEYKNGRRVNITSYVEMALRASSRRAALTAEGAKRDEWGEYLVVSPTLHSTCPSCAYWQGKVLIDDVYANGEPDYEHQVLSYAVKWAWDENSNKVPSHFLGPNCRHPLVTYFEGVTQIPKDSPYDQTRRNYNAEQKQRHLERMIREWKRKAAVAMTEKTMEEAEAKVKEWQNRLNLHILKHIHLREKKEREKIYLPRIAS